LRASGPAAIEAVSFRLLEILPLRFMVEPVLHRELLVGFQ
jgi:hypothetical protein